MDVVAMDGLTTAGVRGPGTGIEHLGNSECWRYLRSVTMGRLAVVDEDGAVDVFPVNHAVDRDSLVLRTADGSKLRAFTTGRDVAYEVDGVDDRGHSPGTAWSVVLRGRAEIITSPTDTLHARSLALAPWQGGTKGRYVRVSGAATGRRFAVTGSGWWS